MSIKIIVKNKGVQKLLLFVGRETGIDRMISSGYPADYD